MSTISCSHVLLVQLDCKVLQHQLVALATSLQLQACWQPVPALPSLTERMHLLAFTNGIACRIWLE